MKRAVLFIVFVGWAFVLSAQPSRLPSWITKKPKPSNTTYYYRVTLGEGINYDKAYANAFAKAILESSWKLGVPVDNQDDLKTVEDGVYDNITIGKTQMNLALNKVCEHMEPLQAKVGVKVYILWQVASSGLVSPFFDDFNDCE